MYWSADATLSHLPKLTDFLVALNFLTVRPFSFASPSCCSVLAFRLVVALGLVAYVSDWN